TTHAASGARSGTAIIHVNAPKAAENLMTNPAPGRPGDKPGRGLFPLVETATVTDPVCGMTVDPATAPASLVHEGRTYHFCCPSCAARFQADPGRYLGGQAPAPPPAPHAAEPAAGATYTCPMHPEVRQ